MADILFLCTGNVCRSPSAELLLDRQFSQSGHHDHVVQSAGTLGVPFGPPERLVTEAQAFGIDLSGHISRKMTTEMIDSADLIVGMAREHVREVVLASAPSFGKTFTLREIVRRGQELGPRAAGTPMSDWLARLHDGRRHADLIGDSRVDDIVDPMGGSGDDYRRMLKDVSALIESLGQLAWP